MIYLLSKTVNLAFISKTVFGILITMILISLLFSFYLLLADRNVNNVVTTILSLLFLLLNEEIVGTINDFNPNLEFQRILLLLIFIIGFIRFIPLLATDLVEMNGLLRLLLVIFVTPLLTYITYLLPFNLVNKLIGFEKAKFLPLMTTLIITLIYRFSERNIIFKEVF